jgi:hypothetical protein
VLATLDSRWYEQNNVSLEDHPQFYDLIVPMGNATRMSRACGYIISNPGYVVYSILWLEVQFSNKQESVYAWMG